MSRFTGNKKIKLSDWENQFLSLLGAEDCVTLFILKGQGVSI